MRITNKIFSHHILKVIYTGASFLFWQNMEKFHCFCAKCRHFGSRTLSKKTIQMHIKEMLDNGHHLADNPWMKQFVDFETIQKNQPLTGLGRFLADTTDPRRSPVHKDTNVTQIAFMVTILKLQNKYGISVADTNNLLALIKKIAPDDAVIPNSVSEIEKSTKDLIVHHQEHLVCQCEEFIFHDDDTVCAVCKSSKEKAKKYYRIPVGPRLQQLREVSVLAELTTLPLQPSTSYVDDLHSAPGYHRYMQHLGDGAIALSYCSDGFNPFHHHITQGSYSIWAQSGLILNLPQHLRTKIGTTLLYGLISGPQSPKHLNIYNQLLIDELQTLKNGLLTFNAYNGKMEMVRVGIMFMVCDVPGAAKEHNRVQQNAKASCGHCHLLGEHSTILDKTTYAGGRKFLSKTDPLRQDTTFHDGKPDDTTIAMRRKSEAFSECVYLDKLQREKRDKGLDIRTLVQQHAHDTGRHGSNQWIRLNMNLQSRQAPVEPMHLMKVVAEHIIKLLNGMEDGPKIRAQERKNGRFRNSCPDSVFKTYVTEKQPRGQKRKRPEASSEAEMDNNLQQSYPKNQLPPAPFTLSQEEKKKADARLQSLKFPANFGVVPTVLFTKICGGTKSHTWYKLFTTGVLRYCLRGMLGKDQLQSLVEFLQVLEQMFAQKMNMDTFPELEARWHKAVCRIERDFPLSLQTLVLHLLHHLPHYVKQYGPPSNFWMFSYERFNHTLSQAITNNQYPELSAVKKIEIQWLMQLLTSANLLKEQPEEDKQADLRYLKAGSFNPSTRSITEEEAASLKTFYKCSSLQSHDVTIYHYARKGAAYFRDITVETKSKERNSIVSCFAQEPPVKFIGQINYFFTHDNSETLQELVSVALIGRVTLCQASKCHYVKPMDIPSSVVISVADLTDPLIHCWEDGILWIVNL